MIRRLFEAGMDAVRLNFSHGSHNEHRRLAELIRRVAEEFGKTLPIIQDLSGPKIRIGVFEKQQIELVKGREFRITTEDLIGDQQTVSTSYKQITADVKPGQAMLLADGMLELKVIEVLDKEVRCEVVTGGILSDRKGINLPDTVLSTPALTEKDKRDLEVGLEIGADYMALSFVQRPEDVTQLRQILNSREAKTRIIAKIERPQAVGRIDEIIPLTDGIMVARGDLGIEIPAEKVPLVQKQLVQRTNDHDLPVIVATQMLESMVEHPRPTRAETSDVANAILDGADVLMLSAETAVGRHPVSAVKTMNRIIREVETHQLRDEGVRLPQRIEEEGLGWIRDETERMAKSICHSAWQLVRDTGVNAICALTKSGYTANLISNFRPRAPIYAYSKDPAVRRAVALCWGVTPRPIEWSEDVDHIVRCIEADMLASQEFTEGDRVAILFGYPFQQAGITNVVLLHRLGAGDAVDAGPVS
jgi:pyruvate kinase